MQINAPELMQEKTDQRSSLNGEILISDHLVGFAGTNSAQIDAKLAKIEEKIDGLTTSLENSKIVDDLRFDLNRINEGFSLLDSEVKGCKRSVIIKSINHHLFFI